MANFDHVLITVHPENTFDNFVEGPCNRIARINALTISEKPGEKGNNPFIIISPVGCGKSHLAQAMYNKLVTGRPGMQVIYVNSQRFLQKYIESIVSKRSDDFMEFCKNTDVLILDDFHCFQGKEKSQEVITEIIVYRIRKKKQLVIATCPFPDRIDGYCQDLILRIIPALKVYIDKPDYKTRLEILKRKVHESGFSINEQVMEYLARKISSDVRSLEGALVSLIGNSYALKKDIDILLAESVLKKILKSCRKM